MKEIYTSLVSYNNLHFVQLVDMGGIRQPGVKESVGDASSNLKILFVNQELRGYIFVSSHGRKEGGLSFINYFISFISYFY